MNETPITLDVLKDMVQNGLVDEIQARELPNGSGYHFIISTKARNKPARILHKTRHPALPRLFKSLDAVADNCRELGFKRFEVFGLV